MDGDAGSVQAATRRQWLVVGLLLAGAYVVLRHRGGRFSRPRRTDAGLNQDEIEPEFHPMSGALKNLPCYTLVIAACYVVAWTAAYVFINGADFEHYFPYLAYFWTGTGGERPGLTGGLSVLLAVPLAVAGIAWRRRAHRHAHKG